MVLIKYSNKWFKSISDEELSAEREPIRVKAVTGGKTSDFELLNRFDNEMIRRRNERFMAEHPDYDRKKTSNREHGWYLPNDD